jgi:membrane-associated phospholipid phosphatase
VLKYVLASSLVVARLSAAQTADTSKTLLTRRDGAVAGAFLLGTAGLSAFDKRIGNFFQDTSLLHVRTGERLDHAFSHINETTLTVGGLVVYGTAKLFKSDLVADVAFHATEAVVLASLTSQAIRGPLGRSRPTTSESQYDFHFFQGFGNFKYRAFPSIHSSSGFAAASVIVAETKRRNPDALWMVAPVAYGLALTPGLARMYLGQHWASDIFAGAFVGTFAGWRVVSYSHEHPRNRLDRIFLGAASHVSIGPGQVALSF